MFILSALGLTGLVGVGEVLRAIGRISPEDTRRVVHAGVGVFVACIPWLFVHPHLVYVLAVLFVVVNYGTLRRGWLQGIHGTARESLGTVTFPLALLPALFICWSADPGRRYALQVAFLVLAFADPLAALAGTRLKRPGRYRVGGHVKSIAGSTAFWIVAFAVSLGALLWFSRQGALAWGLLDIAVAAGLLATVTTVVEALGSRGWDNFFIVQAALLVLIFFDEYPEARQHLLVIVGVGIGFGWAVYRLRLLSLSGALAGGLLALSLLAMPGWGWAVPGFVFFVLSSLLSKVGKGRKAAAAARTEKGDRRDAGQVFANGGVAWALLLAHVLYPSPVLYVGFVGAFAAATADTWGTEIGTLWRGTPRLITTGRPVPTGTSGAVSAIGLAGTALGAAVIGLCGGLFVEEHLAGWSPGVFFGIVFSSGIVAALIDSLVGATVQARYRDPVTGGETERSSSAAGVHTLIRGRRWLKNDQVNAVCTIVGALLAMTCFQALVFAS